MGLGCLLPLALLILWHFVTSTGRIPFHQLPSPQAVWEAGVDLYQRGELWGHVWASTSRVLMGFGLGSGIGIVVASLVGLTRLGDYLLSPLLAAIRAVPSLAWVPLILLWMGIDENARITLVAIGAFFPLFTTLVTALRTVDPLLVEAGRTFGYRKLSLLATIQLPAVVPALIAGLRLALVQSWLFLVAAELLAASNGLGWLLDDSRHVGRVDRMLLAIIILAVLGTLTNAALSLVEKTAARRWAAA